MLRILFITAALLATVGTTVYADATNWYYRFSGAVFGTWYYASDAYGVEDSLVTGGGAYHIGTYHQTDFYRADTRAPLQLVPGQSKTWTFYLWGSPGYNQDLQLHWYWDQASPDFSKLQCVLTYVRAPQDITGGSVLVGTSIVINDNQLDTWTFPAFSTTNGTTGYMFDFTATVIPEPSSLLALLAGLGGFGAVLRRRRT